MKERAFFVYHPRRIANLRVPHLIQDEHPYEIVGTVELSAIDYENFSEDLLADREFLEPYEKACGGSDIYRCVLVKRKKNTDGILVLPEDGCYVKRAAFITQTET